MNRLRTFWEQRTARERRLLAVLAAVLGVLTVWLLLWQPLQRALESQAQRQTRLSALSAQIVRLPPRVDKASVENLLRQRATAQGITLASVKRSDNQLQVAVSVANADALLGWLLALEEQGVVRVRELTMQGKTPADGSVSASLLLDVH
ncbi:type II secretion system protein M [Enterobacteriaceae bacterium 4M9]|nr:type II secretion system protein M [Enterobacteriaceae bacterium 4M9]